MRGPVTHPPDDMSETFSAPANKGNKVSEPDYKLVESGMRMFGPSQAWQISQKMAKVWMETN